MLAERGTFINNLYELRKQHNKTIYEAARACNIDPLLYEEYESGRRTLDVEVIDGLSRLYDCEKGDLIK